MDKFDVSQIPLPDQQPQPIDLNQFPFEILQSQAVSALVSQNEDLMARLSINLKRQAEMESRLLQEAQKFRESNRKLGLLNDQILILKEKNRTVAGKHEDYISKIVELERQVKELTDPHSKTRFALENQIEALQSAEQNVKMLMQSAQENYERRLNLFNRYHRRIRKYIAPGLISLKSQFMQLIDDSEQLKSEWYSQRENLEKAVNRYQKYHHSIRHWIHPQIKQTNKSLKRLQSEHELLLQNHLELKKKQEELLTQLTQQFKEKSVQREEIQALTCALDAKSADYERQAQTVIQKQQLLDAQELHAIELENKVIEVQRRFGERQSISGEEIVNLQSKVNSLKDEKATLEVELKNEKEKTELLAQLGRDSQQQRDRLESENCSLRALWSDHRQKTEELKLQESSLKALNQELMDKLKAERLEKEKIASTLALIESTYQKRLGELEAQLNFLNTNPSAQEKSAFALDPEQMQRLEKMDALIAEIQTGFSVKNRPILKNELPQDLD